MKSFDAYGLPGEITRQSLSWLELSKKYIGAFILTRTAEPTTKLSEACELILERVQDNVINVNNVEWFTPAVLMEMMVYRSIYQNLQ